MVAADRNLLCKCNICTYTVQAGFFNFIVNVFGLGGKNRRSTDLLYSCTKVVTAMVLTVFG